MSTADGSKLSEDLRETPQPVEGLEITEVEGGLVVYDPDRDRVHYLNATASAVFMLCDGEIPRDRIAETTARLFGDAVSTEEVEACLAQLEGERVIRSP